MIFNLPQRKVGISILKQHLAFDATSLKFIPKYLCKHTHAHTETKIPENKGNEN